MKKYIFIFLFIIPLNHIISQDCLLGDCENGYGVKNISDATYSGFWKNGSPNGLGYLKFTSNDAYVGEFKDSVFQGDGAFFKANNEKYFGEFKDGTQDGIGIYQNEAGSTWAFLWSKGQPGEEFLFEESSENPPNCTGNCVNGYGRIENKDGSFILAIYKNRKATFGQIKTNEMEYMGTINNNQPEGFGIMATSGGKYLGYFKDGEKHGLGISVNLEGEVSPEEWSKGELIKPYN